MRRVSRETALDFIALLLFSLGVGGALLRVLGLGASGPAAMLCAAWDAVAVVLAARLRRPLGIGSLIALAAGTLALPLYDWATPLYEVCAPFLGWWASGMPPHPVYSGLGGALLVQSLAALPVPIALWWMLRRAFRLAPFVCAGAAATGLAAAFAPGDAPAVLALCGAGLMILLPRAFHQSLARRGVALGRGALQAMALPAAAVCVAAAFLLVPQDTSAWTCRPLVRALGDAADGLRIAFPGAPAPPGFSIARSGFQPQGERLGGAIAPDENRLFTCRADEPVLLTGAIADTYTGAGWTSSVPGGRMRLDSVFWRGRRQRVFGETLPAGGREARALYERLRRTARLTLTYRLAFPTIFFAGTPQEAEITFPEGMEVYFNERGELFSSDAMGNVSMTCEIWSRYAPGFDGTMLALERAVPAGRDRQWEPVRERFLALPESLPDTVREAARAMAGEGTPYQRARAIEDALGDGDVFHYTLTPAGAQEGDFVAGFLEAREGYCVYFASAMAVLARCEGIPSRYVTGYGLRAMESGGYAAQNDTAHAWAELYFEGIGWVPFDPLRFDASRPAAGFEQPRAPIEPETPEAEPSAPDAPEALPDAAPGWGTFFAALGLLLLLAALTAGVWLLRRWLLGRPERLYRSARVRRICPGAGDALDCYWLGLLRQLELLGLSPRAGETFAVFCARCARRFPLEGWTLLADALAAWRYGGVAPGEDAVDAAADCYLALEARLRETLGHAYLFGRALNRRIFITKSDTD